MIDDLALETVKCLVALVSFHGDNGVMMREEGVETALQDLQRQANGDLQQEVMLLV